MRDKIRMEIKIDTQKFDDKEMFFDALYSQKLMTDDYNHFANECSSPQIRDVFMNILNEEHQIQSDVFDEMGKRGWCLTQPAEQGQIQQAKQKFQDLLNHS